MEETEGTIQAKLFSRFSNQKHRFISTMFFKTREICDFLYFTFSGYTVEVEIKISRSDFLADFKKPKHNLLKLKPKDYEKSVANRFYFAVPEGLITKEEVPDYAGLIYVKKYRCEVVKKAPLNHKFKHDRNRLFDKMYNSYESAVGRNMRLIRDRINKSTL